MDTVSYTHLDVYKRQVWTGSGRFSPAAVDRAAKSLTGDRSLQEQLGAQYKYFEYYQEAYGAVLGLSLIHILYRGVLMGEAKLADLVQPVQNAAPDACQLLGFVDGLAAAAGTAAGAGHDFHKVVCGLAAADRLDELPGIAQAAGYGYADGRSLNIKGRFFPALQPADVLEGVGGGIGACLLYTSSSPR